MNQAACSRSLIRFSRRALVREVKPVIEIVLEPKIVAIRSQKKNYTNHFIFVNRLIHSLIGQSNSLIQNISEWTRTYASSLYWEILRYLIPLELFILYPI